MRILYTIFACYVAVLSVLPCYDGCQDDGEIVYPAAHHAEDGDDRCASDACSPFCTNACCQIHMVCVVKAALPQPITYIQDFNTEYRLAPQPLVMIAIWQPPKI